MAGVGVVSHLWVRYAAAIPFGVLCNLTGVQGTYGGYLLNGGVLVILEIRFFFFSMPCLLLGAQ